MPEGEAGAPGDGRVAAGARTAAAGGARRAGLDEIQKNGDPLVPLANLLQWAYSIDQWHKNGIADGDNELIQLFGADTVGETYNGFRAARMSVAHNLSLVADLVTRPVPRVVQAGLPAVPEFLEVRLPNLLAQKPKP